MKFTRREFCIFLSSWAVCQRMEAGTFFLGQNPLFGEIEFPRTLICPLNTLRPGKPHTFSYLLDDLGVHFIVKLSDGKLVAYNALSSKPPFHLKQGRFLEEYDLSQSGRSSRANMPQLPELALEVSDGNVYATGYLA